jgi:hypothetical protein
MPYTLIDAKGKIMQFYILEVAELYRNLNGGVIVTDRVLEQELVDSLAN